MLLTELQRGVNSSSDNWHGRCILGEQLAVKCKPSWQRQRREVAHHTVEFCLDAGAQHGI
jgi:hypothetical protein